MKKAHTDIANAIVHIDCYEPRREQVRSIYARLPQDTLSLLQYEFRRGPGALPEDFFEAIKSLRVHVQNKIVFIVSAQVFDKEDCAGCIEDIAQWSLRIKFLVYSCLEKGKIQKRYGQMLAPLGDMVDYVEYDVEKKDRYWRTFFRGSPLTKKNKIISWFPSKTDMMVS